MHEAVRFAAFVDGGPVDPVTTTMLPVSLRLDRQRALSAKMGW